MSVWYASQIIQIYCFSHVYIDVYVKNVKKHNHLEHARIVGVKYIEKFTLVF